MAGIYIHIPFCKQACHYCDFHFSTSLAKKNELVDAICKEIELRKDYLINKEISTIYFGGGTPSLLNNSELEQILDVISRLYHVSPNAEITLEANPDDLTIQKTNDLKAIGINRLSIGIQSFLDEHLLLMNRSHTASQAVSAVKHAQKAGIENISIDLIYGLPNLDTTKWEYNLQQAFSLNVPHLSAYCLTVEKRTALNHMVQQHKIHLPEEPVILQQFDALVAEADKHGFIHYEISNFCKEGMYSRHNSSYWKSDSYLGIGPSAHSYNGTSRQWNISNNAQYITGIVSGSPIFEIETLTDSEKFNEYVMTRLRTIWGIDLGYIARTFGASALNELHEGVKGYINDGLLVQDKETVTLTKKGKLLADKIASELFI